MKHAAWIAAFVLGLPAPSYGGQPSTDFDWVTIGSPGNTGWSGDINNNGEGYVNRGSVDYLYRISRLEVTTAQWMEFVNNYSGKSNEWGTFGQPSHWGATLDPNYGGPGKQWVLKNKPNAERFLVAGITWREAAMFCNWLHNGKGESLEAIENGAYNTSTFTLNEDGTFNDQWTHNPDAKYWIPTLDEWLKAAHYDPNRYGPGQEGWWDYCISSDQPPVYGPPGEGQSNAGFELPGSAEWDIPIGSYPEVESPWGLLDTSGSAGEWLEEVWFPGIPKARAIEWSNPAVQKGTAEIADHIKWNQGFGPWVSYAGAGLRVASAVPAPSSGIAFLFVLVRCTVRKRRLANEVHCASRLPAARRPEVDRSSQRYSSRFLRR